MRVTKKSTFSVWSQEFKTREEFDALAKGKREGGVRTEYKVICFLKCLPETLTKEIEEKVFLTLLKSHPTVS